MDMTMASAPSALGGQMGDCDTCAGKTMKPSAVCDLMCSATVAIALETPAVLGVFPLLVNYGLIPEVRAVGRVPAVNLSPPRTTFLI